MEPDLIDLHSKSIDRVAAKWQSSVIINALMVGWVIAIYAGLLKSEDTTEIPVLLQVALTLLHLPAYCMSCLNLWREYRILESLNNLLNAAARNIDKDKAAIIRCVSDEALTLRAPTYCDTLS